MQRSQQHSLLLSAMLALSSPTLVNNPAQAQVTTPIPTTTFVSGQQQVQAPDWSKITWGSLPPIEEGGWIRFPQDLVAKLGYDPSRTWLAGQTPDSFTMLGDVTDAFHMEAFKLKDIPGLTEVELGSLTLKDFGPISWQTLSSLVRAIPNLGDLPVSQVTPIRDLLERVGRGSIWNEKVADIARDKTLGNLPLGKYLDLSKYKLTSIPGLTQTPVGKFRNWQRTYINQVPGLNRVAFDQFPQSVPTGIGLVGIADIVWSAAEHGDPNVGTGYFISGSAKKNFLTAPVACDADKPCAYLELSDPVGANSPLHGKRWVSGKVQQVKGGFGVLARVNNGWEPTGRLVYGPAFKVVLTKTNEVTGRADFALYLRYCHRYPIDLGCTPYFVGGIPWIPVDEGGTLVVAGVTAPELRNIPSKYKDQIDEIERQNQSQEMSQPQEAQTPSDDTSANQTTGSTIQGDANTKIVAAINEMGAFNTSNVPGTDGGQNACMWAVNNVLKEAGYEPLGNDTLAVRVGKADLDNGRGQKVNIADAQPGDIVLVDAGGSRQHIGFCMTDGCTRTISNSSSKGEFSWNGNSNFSYPGSPYNGTTPQVYRLQK